MMMILQRIECTHHYSITTFILYVFSLSYYPTLYLTHYSTYRYYRCSERTAVQVQYTVLQQYISYSVLNTVRSRYRYRGAFTVLCTGRIMNTGTAVWYDTGQLETPKGLIYWFFNLINGSELNWWCRIINLHVQYFSSLHCMHTVQLYWIQYLYV